MATRTLRASVAPIRLIPGMQLRLEAIDATSGAAVTGVSATQWAIYGDNESDPTSPDIEPVLPLLTYGPDTIET